MKITNKYGLPATLVTLASKESYSKGNSEYSTTELMSSPRIRRLQEQYGHLMEKDVSEMIWTLMGSMVHLALEGGKTEGHLTEERLFAEVDGVRISGQIDVQEETAEGTVIIDYKVTSAWKVMADTKDWETQLNIYKWFVETVKRKKVIKLSVMAIIRDWSKHKMSTEGYPPSPIVTIDLPIWGSAQTELYIRQRLEEHRNSKVSSDFGEALPLCSKEERWEKETTYAVKREGRKTAIRVFKTKEEATLLAQKEKGYVETRLGESTCCTGNYCGVNQWCDQFKGVKHDPS